MAGGLTTILALTKAALLETLFEGSEFQTIRKPLNAQQQNLFLTLFIPKKMEGKTTF